ncbi:hypothetical protein [Rhodococcus qingshengii]|uniref:hypothetical protein n=1 Tax=Rhodococcus qingshengii TaxID=334542 RepID=UPI003F514057
MGHDHAEYGNTYTDIAADHTASARRISAPTMLAAAAVIRRQAGGSSDDGRGGWAQRDRHHPAIRSRHLGLVGGLITGGGGVLWGATCGGCGARGDSVTGGVVIV